MKTPPIIPIRDSSIPSPPSSTEDRLGALKSEILALVEDYANLSLAPKSFIPGKTAVPPSGKLLGSQEIKNMVEASLDGWLTAGRFNEIFEKKLADFLGVKHVMTVNSGSSANLVAFNTLTSPKLGNRAIQKGDEVITVAAGFPTTVNPILQFGAVPVFVDIELGTYNINVHLIEQAIGPRTKAIMLAHTLGNPFNLEIVSQLCEKYNLWLVEDCCDALGSTYQGKMVGTFGDIATLSFYPAHHITMGEGGAVYTNSDELRSIAESYRDWGRDCYCGPGKDNTCGRRFDWKLGDLPHGYDHKYTYSHLGYNLKITDMQAACGLAQLEKLPDFIRVRKRNFRFLRDSLSHLKEFLVLPETTPGSDTSWFGFPVTLKESAPVSRLDLLTYLEQERVGTRLLFAGNLIRQPSLKGQTFRVASVLTNTDLIMQNTFWVGLQPSLSESALKFTCERLNIFLGGNF
jgi:CDP-6-deoxy-D-xylo-4-hexulose-3-dehydrase